MPESAANTKELRMARESLDFKAQSPFAEDYCWDCTTSSIFSNCSLHPETISQMQIHLVHTSVIPAKAGIQRSKVWIPAFAGMTIRD